MCNDQVVLSAVQNIIQNMLATEDPSQQQLHFLQSCGFGGLWRFAGPFPKVSLDLNFIIWEEDMKVSQRTDLVDLSILLICIQIIRRYFLKLGIYRYS